MGVGMNAWGRALYFSINHSSFTATERVNASVMLHIVCVTSVVDFISTYLPRFPTLAQLSRYAKPRLC